MLLKVKDLNVYYKNKHIVKNVSFEVDKNEIFCIIGESGSGKSTIAKAIMKMIPYHGEITYYGKDIFMIFQNPGNYLDPLFNVYSQILTISKAIKQNINIDDSIKALRLDPNRLKKAYPYELSGGEQQRVMIAMSLARSSELVIADEPTSSLDVLVQKDVLCAFKEMKRYFSTILITHDLDVVRLIGDRVLVLKDGIIQEVQEVDIFLKSPKSKYGEELIKSFYE